MAANAQLHLAGQLINRIHQHFQVDESNPAGLLREECLDQRIDRGALAC